MLNMYSQVLNLLKTNNANIQIEIFIKALKKEQNVKELHIAQHVQELKQNS